MHFWEYIFDLYFSTNGHHSLNIFPRESRIKYEKILVLDTDLSAVEKHSQILKMHKQFGDATITNLKKLFENVKLLLD